MSDLYRFRYHVAFNRNLGWLTEWEQAALRAKRVAIAGLGGAGGAHLLTLARLGVGAFTIADFDRFDVANFNRQVGATMETLDRPKAAVMEEMARAINPELRIRRFDTAITTAQIDDFLDGAHLFADGLDFFEIPIRRQIFARCAELGIPAVTAAPIGMGTGLLIFTPGGMSFERYFRFEGQPESEQFLRFLVGLAPAGLHRPYLVDRTRVDLAGRKGPSTVAAIQLCAGVVATAAVKLLLGRGGVKAAPWHHQYDAYRDRLAVSRLWFGNAGPLQRLKLAIGRRQFGHQVGQPAAPEPVGPRSVIEEILDLGRWAPSGDNIQPWRFRILDEATVAVDIHQDAAGQLYEYRGGEPTLLAVGMLMETLRIAASGWQRGMVCTAPSVPGLVLHFPPAPDAPPDPLLSYLTLRSVDRRPYARRRLAPEQKRALEACLDADLAVDWHEGAPALWRFGRLNAGATGIRLRAEEAFGVHQRVLDWSQPHSPDRIPVGAIGLPRPMLPLMHWAMQRWERMRLLNRLGGAAMTAGALDLWPAWNSGAFFVVRVLAGPEAEAAETGPARLLRIGRCLQRLWLTATRLGLVVQPVLATVAFAEYGARGTAFTGDRSLLDRAALLARQFSRATGREPGEVVFVGRIGAPRPGLPGARSTRLPLDQLIQESPKPEMRRLDVAAGVD
jgi:molybdopterin/thiamine biosynthesis adenylyltransferase